MRIPSHFGKPAASLLLLLSSCLPLVGQRQPEGFLTPPGQIDPSVYSQLTSASTRFVVPLNGPWQASFDDGDSWRTVQIPSSYDDEDQFRLRRTFTLSRDVLEQCRWKLVCYGIQYQSTITINGQFVAQHESGTPFTINIPDEVKLHERNTIAIDVTNRLDYTSTVPLRKLLLGNRTYGGVFRDVLLVGVPRVWLDQVRVDAWSFGADAEADFRIDVISAAIRGMRLRATNDTSGLPGTIEETSGSFELSIQMLAPAVSDSAAPAVAAETTTTFTLESKRTATLNVTVPLANPVEWGPGSPFLYEAVVQVRYKGALVDEQKIKVGFRALSATARSEGPRAKGTQAAAHDGLLLNGKPIIIRGIVYVEDSKSGGATLTYAQMRKDLVTIRDMGVNLVRFIDGVPHPYLLQLCDEFGLMAVVDVPIGSPPTSLFGDASYLKRSTDRVRFTVEEGSEYTCVVAYGLSAIIPGGSDVALEAVRQMREVVDSLDHRLFIFSATDWGDARLRLLTDIAAVSAFDLNPVATRARLMAIKAQLKGERPLVLACYGKFVQLGNHGGYSDSISIEAQAKYISDIYTVLADVGAAGGVYWAFNDYRTDRPILTVNNSNQYVATCGLYGLDRDLRQGASMLAALYTDQKPPEVLIGDYSPPSTILFIATGIGCAILFLVLINSSRRFRENVFRALLRPFNFYSDIRDQRILSTVHTTVLAVVIAVTLALIVTSLCYYYRMDETFDATLSATITWDWVKEVLNYVVWRPALAIVLFAVYFIALLMAVAGLIRVCATFVRNKIFFRDAYVIAVWGALPVLILIVPAMILYRALAVPGMGVVTFSIMILVALWMVYRVLRGTAVIYDVRPMKVYAYTLGSIVALILIVIATSGETNATFAYLREGIGGLYGGH